MVIGVWATREWILAWVIREEGPNGAVVGFHVRLCEWVHAGTLDRTHVNDL